MKEVTNTYRNTETNDGSPLTFYQQSAGTSSGDSTVHFKGKGYRNAIRKYHRIILYWREILAKTEIELRTF